MVWQNRMMGCVAALLFGGVFFALTASQASAGQACGEILKENCQSCHSLARTCDGLGRYPENWQKTITKMAAYSSAITQKDQKTLVKCLTKQKKDIVELCRQ